MYNRRPCFGIGRGCVMRRDGAKAVALAEVERAELSLADASGILEYGLEYWLKLAGRTRNYPKHFGRCCLLFQCFAQVIRALAQLVEQPRVLDGNNPLLGEIAQKLNLLVGEWTNLLAKDRKNPDSLVLLEPRYDEDCPNTSQFDSCHCRRITFDVRVFSGKIDHMHRLFGSRDPHDRSIVMRPVRPAVKEFHQRRR